MYVTTTEALDSVIEQCKSQIEFGKAIERLNRNPDFKKVILEGYLEQEAIRLVHASSSAAFDAPDKRAALMREIDGIGKLASFFRVSQMLAERAEGQLVETEELRQEMIEGNYDE